MVKLKEMYVDNQLSLSEISKILKIDRRTIENRLRKININIRGPEQTQIQIKKQGYGYNKGILKGKTYEEIYGNKKGQEMRKIRSGKNNPVNKHPEIVIGKNNGMYGKHHNEDSKQKIRENIPKRYGANSPNWKGGLTFIPYCYKFNKQLKEKIRKRDNYKCQECGKTELENGRKLTCHHIHYDKPNCNPDLISLCNSCNAKANFNRDYWEEHFIQKVKEIS